MLKHARASLSFHGLKPYNVKRLNKIALKNRRLYRANFWSHLKYGLLERADEEDRISYFLRYTCYPVHSLKFQAILGIGPLCFKSPDSSQFSSENLQAYTCLNKKQASSISPYHPKNVKPRDKEATILLHQWAAEVNEESMEWLNKRNILYDPDYILKWWKNRELKSKDTL